MTTTILKTFGTGQITIPKKWRTAPRFLAKQEKGKIILEPMYDEETIFDAHDFNNGQGVQIGDFIQVLENSLKDE